MRAVALAAEVPLLFENVFGVSEEATLFVANALMIKVKDAVTGKPIVGASVIVDTNEKATDETGIAIFEALAPGTYTVQITPSGYFGKKFSVTVTAEGEVREVTLIPMWIAGVGIVAGGLAATLIVTKALKWW